MRCDCIFASRRAQSILYAVMNRKIPTGGKTPIIRSPRPANSVTMCDPFLRVRLYAYCDYHMASMRYPLSLYWPRNGFSILPASRNRISIARAFLPGTPDCSTISLTLLICWLSAPIILNSVIEGAAIFFTCVAYVAIVTNVFYVLMQAIMS